MKSKQSGFTLVEISIVLIIVGLLLGGVLKGQELITSGKAKALYADRAAIQTAYNTYNDRFRAVPGDDSSASRRFSGLACGVAGATASAAAQTCINGNGNGLIDPYGYEGDSASSVPALTADPVAGVSRENYKFWQHVRVAQLIKIEGSQSDAGAPNAIFSPPLNATSGRIAINSVRPYFGQQESALYFITTNVPGNVATAVDGANDDGFTNRGGIRSVNNGTAASPNTNAAGLTYGAGVAATMSTNLL